MADALPIYCAGRTFANGPAVSRAPFVLRSPYVFQVIWLDGILDWTIPLNGVWVDTVYSGTSPGYHKRHNWNKAVFVPDTIVNVYFQPMGDDDDWRLECRVESNNPGHFGRSYYHGETQGRFNVLDFVGEELVLPWVDNGFTQALHDLEIRVRVPTYAEMTPNSCIL